MKTKEKSDEGFGPPLAQLPVREQARQVLRRIQESNVRLSFGPGMHVMTPDKFVFDAVLEALEAAEARALAAEQERDTAEGRLTIRVEKLLLAKLGREWTGALNESVVALIDELAGRAERA